MKYTVIQAIYLGDRKLFFKQAIDSVIHQSIRPEKIIIVCDGPILSENSSLISSYERLYGGSFFCVIRLNRSVGLAACLNIAINRCETKYIARMDSDDISKFDRFEKQLKYLEDHAECDIVGSWIEEIDENNKVINPEITYPIEHQECLNFFKKRSPVAHPAIMLKRSFFTKIGRFYNENYMFDQDSELWAEGFSANCIFANIPEVLLSFRRGDNFFQRRNSFQKNVKRLLNRVKINKKLSFGVDSYIWALFYFMLSFLPVFLKKLLYRYRNFIK
jgi:glycosyltransferase involved in cell wall biosynthesis